MVDVTPLQSCGIVYCHTWQEIFQITDPGYNNVSFGWAAIDMACIFITITMMVVESTERYQSYFKDPFETPLKRAIYSIDVFVNSFFTIDLLVKWVTYLL